MILGVVVALQDHGTSSAKVFPLHVDVAFQVWGEDALYQLGEERVFVWAQVELRQLGGQRCGPENMEKKVYEHKGYRVDRKWMKKKMWPS